MKSTVLCLILCFLGIQLSAQSVADIKINRSYENNRMTFILADIERKYNVVFRYNEEILPKGYYDYQFDGLNIRFLPGDVTLENLTIKPRANYLDSLKKIGEAKPQVFEISLNEFKLKGFL